MVADGAYIVNDPLELDVMVVAPDATRYEVPLVRRVREPEIPPVTDRDPVISKESPRMVVEAETMSLSVLASPM